MLHNLECTYILFDENRIFLGLAVVVYLVFRVKSGFLEENVENIYSKSLLTHSNTVFAHILLTIHTQRAHTKLLIFSLNLE